MEMSHSPEESERLSLLMDVQKALSLAIQSLDDKAPPPANVDCQYLQSAAAFVNCAADGYLVVREAFRVDASKLLVRPILESVFKAAAVMRKPGFLTRLAYSEWKEELRMFKKDPAGKAASTRELEEFKKRFSQDNPGYPAVYSHASISDTATEAGMKTLYETTYGTYCAFTHAALAAVHGPSDGWTDNNDTGVVTCCIMVILELLNQHTPAQVPDIAPFRERLTLQA